MFGNIQDLLMLNEIYRGTATTERHKMTGELINYRKFSSEEVKTIVDLSLDDLKELEKKRKCYYLDEAK